MNLIFSRVLKMFGNNVNLDASGFGTNLTTATTDVQALAEAVDTLSLGGTPNHNDTGSLNTGAYRHLPASTAASDFGVGESGTGNWVKKTLSEVLAILHVSPGTIGGTTPGIVYGLNKEIYKTANADSPLTALQCSGTVVSNYGMTDADCAITLPTAAEGLAFVAVLPAVRARYFKFRAGTNDKIYLIGVAGSDNGYVGVASGYATGSSASFFTFKASDGGFDWFCIPIFGTWVAS